ncbi:MAG: site-specific DNA-methyltransferase [Muribaculaceae bacterium]|nr:site-specific DNA-methyltransferase [Muribaculaceae bacterium]
MKATEKFKLIDRIRTLDGLTDDERAALLGLLNESKTYGLVWENKSENVEERLRSELPVLKEVRSRAIISEHPDAPDHILIEGDNLDALTALTYTHEGKIDVIYIDPPYNTGNHDFSYNDRYVDSDDAYRHSMWLSFMQRRLRIAKKLLSDRGVIFISIGDDEVANLKLLCDEIFQNIALVPRIAKKGSNQGTHFRPTKDYVIVCCKKIENVNPFVEVNMTSDAKAYKYTEESTGRRFRKGHSFYQASLDPMRGCRNQRYYMQAPDGTLVIPPGNAMPDREEDAAFVVPVTKSDKVWRWSYQSYLQKKDLIIFAKSKRSPLIDSHGNHTDWNVYEKKYADEEAMENTTLPNDVIPDFINTLGTTLLREMQIDFSYSKPIELIKYLILIAQFPDDIRILDFFAGSGTTLHAVMQLNAEDGGRRQCILCTNNENGICENVTYRRNRMVIQGYAKPDGEIVEGLPDNNLRYYRTEFVGRRHTPQNMRRLMLLSSDMICIREGLYNELDEFAGLPTIANGFRYFSESAGHMLIIYNEEAIYDIVQAIEMTDFTEPIGVYVFSPSNDAWNSDFECVRDKIRHLTALPAAIYNVYKRILPRPTNLWLEIEENPESETEEQDHV